MNLERRYFIMDKLQAAEDDEKQALQMCIGMMYTQRYSLDGSKLLIKTTQHTINQILSIYPEFTEQDIMDNTFSKEYTLEQIKVIMNSSEWTAPFDLDI